MLRDLAERLYRESHWPVTGTATSGTTTTLVDTAGLVYSSGDANQFDRKYAYIEFSTGESSRVTEGGYAGGTGTLTLSPAVTDIGTENYIITDQHIDVLKNAINRIQRNLFLETFYPLSLHVVANDANDMEPSTIATDYNSTGATLATESTIVRNGVQSLKSTATVAGGFANLDAVIGVQEGQSLYAAVDCYVTSGDDAQFAILNKFNAQLIDTATSDEPSWMELVIQFTIPPSCEQIDLIMSGDASGDVTYWANPQVWGGTRVYPVPSWIQRESQVIDVREFPLGETGPGTNDYLTNTRLSRPLEWWFEREDTTATEKVHIGVKAGSGRPYIVASRPLGELTTDTAVTRVSQDLVVQGAMYYISKARAAKLMSSNPSLAGFHNSRAREYGRAYSRMLKDLGIPEVRLRDESTDRQSVRFR
jgi:hypothetical protein